MRFIMFRWTIFYCGFSLFIANADGADWPLFRGTPSMQGVGEAKLPDKLEERWVFKAGNSVEGAPAVMGNVVFVASLDKHLYALDLVTGKEKWKAKLGPMRASPSVKNGRVYIGDSDGKF
jgi:outer membrane protein assembly factor BamB